MSRHIKAAGRQFLKNFWVVVAFVAVVAGAMGFEDQRRGPGARSSPKWSAADRDGSSSEGDPDELEERWGYSAASFMG